MSISNFYVFFFFGIQAYGSSEEMVHGTAEGGAAETGTAGGVEGREEGRK